MNTRRAYVDLIYNGTAATAEISGFVTDISYTDPASGEADSLDITLQDRDRRWTGAWIPVAGDTLAATIRALNCQYSGDNRILPCGFFIVDSFSFSGWPVSGSISAISTPLDSSFTTTQRTKTWENVTIKEIGTEIAGRAGIALAQAVEEYKTWQRTIGRDVNPSQLAAMVMEAGAKRVTVTAPTFAAVAATKVAALTGSATVTYGGLEDD